MIRAALRNLLELLALALFIAAVMLWAAGIGYAVLLQRFAASLG